MRKKLLAAVVTLILLLGFVVPVYAGFVCETLPLPEECQKQTIIEFQNFSVTRGPVGGGGIIPPPPITK